MREKALERLLWDAECVRWRLKRIDEAADRFCEGHPLLIAVLSVPGLWCFMMALAIMCPEA